MGKEGILSNGEGYEKELRPGGMHKESDGC